MYSEKDVMPDGLSWGEWEFSMSDEHINEKLSSLSGNNDLRKNEDCWINLFSLLKSKVSKKDLPTDNNVSVLDLKEDSLMECSSIFEANIDKTKNSDTVNDSVEDMTICLVDLCNQSAPTLKSGINSVQEEMSSFMTDVIKLNEYSIVALMEKGWSQIHSDGSRMCFCVAFSFTPELCKKLSTHILFPWMSNNLPTKLEQLSKIIAKEGEIFCRYLIAPLLLIENSPLVKDLYNVEEVMTCLDKRNWKVILDEVLGGITDLENWNIPVLALVVENSEPTLDNISRIVQLMSLSGSSFATSRDFGSLLVNVLKCVKTGFGSVVAQLKVIANSYKGPLKFKALKMLSEIKE